MGIGPFIEYDCVPFCYSEFGLLLGQFWAKTTSFNIVFDTQNQRLRLLGVFTKVELAI